VSSCSLNEVQNDLNEVDDVNRKLNFLQSFVIDFLTIFLDLDEIDTLESDDVWGNEQCVDSDHGDQEVPNFAECPFCVDEIPFELRLGVDDLGSF
jgi:hypothetical protein